MISSFFHQLCLLIPGTILGEPYQKISVKDNNCPICKKDDRTQKVSYLHESGINFVSKSGPLAGVGLNSDGKIGVGIGISSGKEKRARESALI